nr:hypothetical protein [Nannocystis pusilla]
MAEIEEAGTLASANVLEHAVVRRDVAVRDGPLVQRDETRE